MTQHPFPPAGDWMQSVAAALSVRHGDPRPFTLGEAVDELGRWARMARADAWLRANLRSLDRDVSVGLAAVGAHLHAQIADLIPDLQTRVGRKRISSAAQQFAERWGSAPLVEAAFLDLCEAAAEGSATTDDLIPVAAVVISQVGPPDRAWWTLSEAAQMLDGSTDEDDRSSEPPAASERLEAALARLQEQPPAGHVVVWRLYRRAVVPFRVTAGPITLMRADWVVPNAERDDGQAFPERDELRAVIRDNPSLSEAELIRGDGAEERYVLGRVDLGHRSVVGAADEARRRIEALVNIAIEAGGASWIDTGTSVTLVDGASALGSFGMNVRPPSGEYDDSYGMGATSELVDYWAKSLGEALAREPMPEFLVEALAAVREAGLIDHRDVHSLGARPVTPRLATALEDHAVELVASLGGMTTDELMDAMSAREEDRQVDRAQLGALLAPMDHLRRSRYWGDAELGDLERSFARFDRGGVRIVTLSKAWEARDRLRALPMPPATRQGLERSLEAVSTPSAEERAMAAAQESVADVRSRHRRVRNAITHGNPVTAEALESVRGFSQRIAREAVNLALNAFASHRQIRDLVDEEASAREARRDGVASGRSRLDRERTDDE